MERVWPVCVYDLFLQTPMLVRNWCRLTVVLKYRTLVDLTFSLKVLDCNLVRDHWRYLVFRIPMLDRSRRKDFCRAVFCSFGIALVAWGFKIVIVYETQHLLWVQRDFVKEDFNSKRGRKWKTEIMQWWSSTVGLFFSISYVAWISKLFELRSLEMRASIWNTLFLVHSEESMSLRYT